MTVTLTRETIAEGVCFVLSESLAQELDAVTPAATFFNDLEGESIDLIDVTFRCERRFGCRIQLQSLMSGLQLDSNGRLSATSVQDLNSKIPQINWFDRVALMSTDDPRDLLTVDLITELVFHAVQQKLAATK